MNILSRLTVACAASLALGGVTAIAHHSAAAFDTQKEVTVNGTIKSYRFANPHVQLIVTVKKDDGSSVDMDVEAGAASVLNGLGFTKDSLKVGDVVTITGNPSRKTPDTFVLGKDLTKGDGTYLPLNIGSRSAYEVNVNATATSIEGTWFPPFNQLSGVLGATRKFQLTDKGKAAQAERRQMDLTQRDC